MKVCFVRHQAFPLFDPSAHGMIGGAEVRAFNFARALAQCGAQEVSFVVRSSRARAAEEVSSVTVHFDFQQLMRPRYGALKSTADFCRKVPVITWKRLAYAAKEHLNRFRRPKPETTKLLKRVDADVYCCFGANHDSANTIHTAKKLKKRAVLFIASDNDLCDAYRDGSRDPDVLGVVGSLCRYAIQNADRIVVQSEWQRQRLAQQFQRGSVLIRNPIDLHTGAAEGGVDADEGYALWVGREDSFAKRPDRCIELASHCPEIPFVMIVNRSNPETFANLVLSAPKNMTIIESVPYHQIEDYFRRAAVLVNTSTLEGFPNTFLQAAKYGVPILSWKVDPEGMLETHGCGRTADDDPQRMLYLLRQFMSNRSDVEAMGRAARRYAEVFHKLEDRAAELEAVLKETAESGDIRRDPLVNAA